MEFSIEKVMLGLVLLGSSWVIWLLILLSVIGLGVFLNRIYYFSKAHATKATFLDDLRKKLSQSDAPEIEDFLVESAGIEPIVVWEGLRILPKGGPERAADAMHGRILKEKLSLERYLGYLGTLGNNAPFIGLLGTVLGIVRAFYDLSLNPTQGSAAVMAGISEALVATALGLFVAIPSVMAYNYFTQRIKRIVSSCQVAASTLLAFYDESTGESRPEQPG